jgi:hypothetical protein
MGKKVVVAVRFELTTFAGALARKGSGQVSLPLHQPATLSTLKTINIAHSRFEEIIYSMLTRSKVGVDLLIKSYSEQL